jgi:hypothetical protein
MALATPSKDSLVIGEAVYPCSFGLSAPSSATDLVGGEGASKSHARCDGFPHREHNNIRLSVDQICRALMAARDPSEPSKQNSTGSIGFPPAMIFLSFSL